MTLASGKFYRCTFKMVRSISDTDTTSPQVRIKERYTYTLRNKGSKGILSVTKVLCKSSGFVYPVDPLYNVESIGFFDDFGSEWVVHWIHGVLART
jgi:hypothetical protein